MRLLIVTQMVDQDDPVLGFFVRWIEEFSKHVERLEIICLKEGKHTLPSNVRVHSLGKERGASRLSRIVTFYRLIRKLRYEYDAVFVHMNPEYVILGGLLWKAWHKRVALWYTHKSVNLRLRMAEALADVIFTASKESFRLRSRKLHAMGHGIDSDFFSPDPKAIRSHAVLSVGRLSLAKRHDLVIRAAAYHPYPLWIIGEGPERKNLEKLAEHLSVSHRVRFFGGHTQDDLLEEYRHAGVFAHTSETGSLDKVVLEALACGLPVVTTSAVLYDLPVTAVEATPEALAKGILAAEEADPERLSRYVRDNHSLGRLVPAMLDILKTI